MKIVVFVDGGNVQEVYAPVRDAEHIDVVLVDFDNLKESHSRDERDAILERETDGLTATFVTAPSESEAA